MRLHRRVPLHEGPRERFAVRIQAAEQDAPGVRDVGAGEGGRDEDAGVADEGLEALGEGGLAGDPEGQVAAEAPAEGDGARGVDVGEVVGCVLHAGLEVVGWDVAKVADGGLLEAGAYPRRAFGALVMDLRGFLPPLPPKLGNTTT